MAKDFEYGHEQSLGQKQFQMKRKPSPLPRIRKQTTVGWGVAGLRAVLPQLQECRIHPGPAASHSALEVTGLKQRGLL